MPATQNDANRSAAQRIVILGGGFAGVTTAMNLERLMSADERRHCEVVIVNNENYFVFQPLLPEVVSGTIETLHCITPIRRLARRATLYTRHVTKIDLEKRQVHLAPGFQPKTLVLDYDHLVIGLGTRLNYSLVPGMREHANPFKYLGDALQLRNEVVQALEEANIEAERDEKRKLLTFVVAGGGFSGVECIAELNDFLHCAVSAYPNIEWDEVRCILLQSAERILPELGESLAQYAHQILEKRGIEIRLNTRLKAVSADAVIVEPKSTGQPETIPTRTVVTTVPAAPHPIVATLPCPKDKGGRITTTEFLDVPGFDGLWALGDCAAVPQKDGITSPPTAQHAVRQADTCARNILATMRGGARRPFAFTGLGKMASLGRRSAVAEVFGIKLRGVIAWLFWRAVYLMKFPGLDRKIRILLDWTMDLILPRDITQLRIFDVDAVQKEHFHAGEFIFDQGDFGDRLYVLAKGTVEILQGGNVLRTLQEGDVFGEIALLSTTTRTAQARAATPVDVITVRRRAFHQLVTHLPGVRDNMTAIMQKHGMDPQTLANLADESGAS